MLYRCPGLHQCPGGTFSSIGANDQAEFNQRIAEGWHPTMPEAMSPPKPEPVTGGTSLQTDGEDLGIAGLLPDADSMTMPEQAPLADNTPPTRAELEAKAAELGITIDGRWRDAKIASLIAEALAKV